MYNTQMVGLHNGQQAVSPTVNFGNLGRSHAVLYLFQKAELPAHYRRSYKYNLNGEFTKELESKMDSKLNKLNGGGWNHLDDCMYDSVRANVAVMPTSNAIAINTNNFSQSWSFILLIQGSEGAVPFAVVPAISTNELYSGFLIDEPYSQYTLSLPGSNLSTAYNPNCRLQITHYTKFSAGNSLDASGYNTGANTVTGDYDVVTTDAVQQVTPASTTLCDLQPGKLIANTRVDAQYNTFQSPDDFKPLMCGDSRQIYVPSKYNDPRQHIGQLVDAMVQFRTGLAPTEQYLGMQQYPGEVVTAADVMIQTASNTLLSEFNPSGRTALDPAIPISLAELDRKYPDMNVLVIDRPYGLQYNAIDTRYQNKTNVLSSIITSAMPALLIDAGLSSIGFNYCSWQPDAMGHLGICNITNFSTFYPVTDTAAQYKINQFKWLFVHNIVPIITSTAGDFYLLCNTSISGSTILDFRLKEYGNENQGGLISVDNRLGGFSSPLVGTADVARDNARQLASVITNMAAPNQVSGLPDSPAMPYQLGN